MRRALVPLPGHPHTPAVGVNFLSRAGGPRMWTPYDEGTVHKELRVLADLGIALTRSFVLWRDLAPRPDAVDRDVLDRLGNFLDLHAGLGLRTVPTLLVANLAGEDGDPPWREGRDPYTDPWLVGRQVWLAEQVARTAGGHPAIAGWLLGRRLPHADGTHPDAVSAWAEAVVRGLRSGGAAQPVSLGEQPWRGGAWRDGPWSAYLPASRAAANTVRRNGARPVPQSVRPVPLLDWVGLHAYPGGEDPVREHPRCGLACELAGEAGKPVVVEEFGAAGAPPAGDPGAYHRQVLHHSLLGGATGWFAWPSDPSDPSPQDTGPAPALRELAGFREILEAVEPHRCTRADTEVALLLTPEVRTGYPVGDAGSPVPVAALEQAYLACRQAGTPPGLITVSGGIRADCLLYLLPSASEVTAPVCRRLEELAQRGATVYVSYLDPGTGGGHEGWHAGLDRFFGVRHLPPDAPAGPAGAGGVRMTLRDTLGNLTAGTELRFTAGQERPPRVCAPVEPVEAQVLATAPGDRPVLLHRTVGAGAVILCCYPLEALAAGGPADGARDLGRLYAALAHAAGAHPPVRVDRPGVLVDCLDRDDGTRFVWLVSQSAQALTVAPRTRGGAPLHDLRSGAPVSTVDLPPYGLRVLRTQS